MTKNYEELVIELHEAKKKIEFYEREIGAIKKLITNFLREDNKNAVS